MALGKLLREDIFRRIEMEYKQEGIIISALDYKERNRLFVANKELWSEPDAAYREGVNVVCPICLEVLEYAKCPLDPLERRFARHKRGGGKPACKELTKGRIHDIHLGVDKLFGPDPRKKRKEKTLNLEPIKIEKLQDIPGSDFYVKQNPYDYIDGEPMHRLFLFEGSGDEKIKAICGIMSEMDDVLGVSETNGQAIVEVRNFEKQYDCFLDQNIVTFVIKTTSGDLNCELRFDVEFCDELEYDETGKPMTRLQDAILSACTLQDQYDEANGITRLYPNKRSVLIKGVFHKKKAIHNGKTHIVIFKVKVFSDWDIYVVPNDMYK